ncbi:MAG: trigger factor [Paludibacteraceae bacterium]|nr:trigger factor [Paludibacteraceae bacterium]
MNVSQNNNGSVSATLLVKVGSADYAPKMENAIKEFRKKAKMPGFRPGQVPAGLVKKMYGKELLAEEVNKLISEALYDYIKDKDLNILGEPLPTVGFTAPDLVEGNDFEFSFDVALAPDINLSLNKKNKIKYFQIDVDKALIEKQTAAYRGRYGKYVQADKVEEKDVVKGELAEVDSKGKVVEGGVTVANALLSPNYMKNKKEQAKVMGATVGATFVFNPAKAFDNEAEIASLLQIDKEAAKAFTADCQFTVKEITRFAEAEMNQEFFDACFGAGTVKSEAEFSDKIKAGLEEQFVADSDVKFMIDLRDMVLSKMKDAQFDDDLLKRWLKANNDKMTDEQIESDYPKMIEDLKWQLFQDKFAKDNKLTIEKADLDAVAKRLTKAQFAQYGMLNVPDDIVENYMEQMMKDKDGARRVADRAMEDKIIAAIKDQVSVDETKISFEDFNKFFEK